MSVASMSVAPRVVIDLTLDESTASTTVLSPATWPRKHTGFSASAEEPPIKKQRVGKSPRQRERESSKAFVQQIFVPHVHRAVQRLAPTQYAVEKIAIEAVTKLIVSTGLLDRYEAANGVVTTHEATELENRAALLVKQLASLPEYQRRELKVETSLTKSLSTPPISPKAELLSPEEPAQPIPHAPAKLDSWPSRVPKPRVRPRQLVRAPKDVLPAVTAWLQLQRKPYLNFESRNAIALGLESRVALRDCVPLPVTYHADFTSLEITAIIKRLEVAFSTSFPRTKEALNHLAERFDLAAIIGNVVEGRTADDIRNFCSDIKAGKANTHPQTLSLKKSDPTNRDQNKRTNQVSSMLLARELEGNAGFGCMRQYHNFQNQFRICHQDGLSVIAEFTNCAGDITAMSWVPNGNIICGTTAHSDSHNQQYNKPGNLLLCSTTKGTLQAFADHRIPRPLVETGENSTDAMRQSQDPWLYSSVVSTDYDGITGRAFTSSFDKTVKVWDVSSTIDSMEAIATWHHQGNVNFVAAAKDGSGYVATAADIPTAAVRIYTINPTDIQRSEYYTVSCTRNDAEQSDKWAYFPATMQWGRAPGTRHLLAIGYSPRSLTSDDSDIPEDKLHSGEIVLWDAAKGVQIPVLTATTANVFEIMWHPTIPRFIVATSPSGLIVEQGTRTNIHIFHVDRERQDGAYSEIQKLDCPASDINELTIMPNSLRHAFITAGCTDGKVYVWDTAQGDRPMHVLKHGYPLDDFMYDREKEDTGVKFCAWGTTADRFYTGSSDGIVKVWNIRRKSRPFVRNLLEAPGPISSGVFSPDHSKLAIGDATGRVFLLSVDKRDALDSHFTTLPGLNRRIRRPKPFTPHPEPPPPLLCHSAPTIAQYSREAYLRPRKLILHNNPVIGAVQGPLYHETLFYRRDAHAYFDPEGPLLPEFERTQRSTIDASIGPRSRSLQRLKDPSETPTSEDHAANLSRDLDVATLSEDVIEDLVQSGAQLRLDGEEGWDFTYEEMPSMAELSVE